MYCICIIELLPKKIVNEDKGKEKAVAGSFFPGHVSLKAASL